MITLAELKLQQDLVLERLFSSRVRIQLLSLFLLHPDRREHIRALASEIEAQYSAVWKELNNLEEAGLLVSEEVGGRKVYALSPDSPILPELRNILLKTLGAGELARDSVTDIEGLEAAFIFGSFAEGEVDAESDLDLMLIGDPDVAQVAQVIDDLEGRLAREVNYALFTLEEWNSRLEEEDPFATDVRAGAKVMLVGSEDDL